MINKRRNTRLLLFVVISVLIIIIVSFYVLYSSNYPRDQKEHQNIEFEGIVNYVVDGDTLDINDNRIRLSLVNTPERGQKGYMEAKKLLQTINLKA